jgi:hypothetical protein
VRLEREAGELEAEARRLGVDPVRAPDARRVGELARAVRERGRQLARAGHDRRPGGPQLQRERRVQDVGGREAEVDPASGRPRRGGEDVDERGHVVVGDALALLDGLDGEGGGADGLELGLGRPVERLRGGDLDVAPGRHAGFVGPDGAELGARVAGDHAA